MYKRVILSFALIFICLISISAACAEDIDSTDSISIFDNGLNYNLDSNLDNNINSNLDNSLNSNIDNFSKESD